MDEVTAAATSNLPSAQALREMIRRRRASGGPAEHTFASLVGLELRPRRLRDASALWAQLREERGIEGRDAIWQHPDLMPTSKDLDDPAGFSKRRELLDASDSDVDAALRRLLDGGFDTPEDDGAADSEDGTESRPDNGDGGSEGDGPDEHGSGDGSGKNGPSA